jgi:hypothetical protein
VLLMPRRRSSWQIGKSPARWQFLDSLDRLNPVTLAAMRYILAILSFVIAAPPLAYAALVGYQLTQVFQYSELDFSEPEIRFAFVLLGGSLLIGFVFVVAGVAMLIIKPRRE